MPSELKLFHDIQKILTLEFSHPLIFSLTNTYKLNTSLSEKLSKIPLKKFLPYLHRKYLALEEVIEKNTSDESISYIFDLELYKFLKRVESYKKIYNLELPIGLNFYLGWILQQIKENYRQH